MVVAAVTQAARSQQSATRPTFCLLSTPLRSFHVMILLDELQWSMWQAGLGECCRKQRVGLETSMHAVRKSHVAHRQRKRTRKVCLETARTLQQYKDKNFDSSTTMFASKSRRRQPLATRAVLFQE